VAFSVCSKPRSGSGANNDPYDGLNTLGVSWASCKEYRDNYCHAPSGVYKINFPSVGVKNMYCNQETKGGGWMLILTLGSGNEQYPGSKNPFTQSLNEGNPSPATAYSTPMNGKVLPDADSEFLLQRQNGDWVRFEVDYSWCGGEDWDYCTDATGCDCHGASTHIQFAKGQLYDSDDNALYELGNTGRLMDRFNGCMCVNALSSPGQLTKELSFAPFAAGDHGSRCSFDVATWDISKHSGGYPGSWLVHL